MSLFQQNDPGTFQISQYLWDTSQQYVYLPIYLRDLHLPGIWKFLSEIPKIKIWSIIKFWLHWIGKRFSAAVSSIYVLIWHNCFEDPVTGLNMHLVRKL